MHYFLLICFNTKPLQVSSSLVAYHEEDRLCIKQQFVQSCVMLTGCWQQPVNTMHDYTNCCLYTVDPPDDE